jgi:ribonuclease J
MRVRIHRGAHEIGGSCVEVEADGARLILDVGRPLTAKRGDVIPLPSVAGFVDPDPSLVGVIISHAHQDHWGLVGQVPPGVPLYLGEATQRILKEAAFWTDGLVVAAAGFLVHRQPFDVGPFRVTPYLNDHCAFDAYSLLIEGGGKRLFYSGDIRGHGRKAGIFEELLRKPPPDIDVLLMEGTNIRPAAGTDDYSAQQTEAQVEAACVERFRATKGMALVVTSAQNIDRLVTLYRATLQADRDLVMDLYGASIARATGNADIPRPGPDWPRIRVYVPLWQRVKVKDARDFERVGTIKPYRVFEEELAVDPSRWVTTFSMSSAPQLADCLAGATLTWSLWAGYLAEPSGERLKAFLAERDISLEVHHTSGHASVSDLQRLAAALDPKRIVPIHSFGGHRFAEYFEGVESQDDGKWWDA